MATPPSANAIAAKKLMDSNDFYKKLYRKFDKSLNSCLESFQKTINVTVTKAENRLYQCEQSMHLYMKNMKKSYEVDLTLAENLVNKELKSKVIMSQWTNMFLTTTEQSSLDALTFAISRFALNVCLCFRDVTPAYIVETQVHKNLIYYIGSPHKLVVGPSMMALVHISLYPELKAVLVQEGLLPSLLQVMYNYKSKPILALCGKLCASIAIEPANKFVMAQSGCFHALIDMVLGSHNDVDQSVQFFTLCAIVNTVYKNDSNRLLSIELNCIRPLITTLQSSSNEDILLQAMRALANISYGNSFTANTILLSGGGEVIVEVLQCIDILKQSALVHAALTTLSNICHAEINQTHVGNIVGLLETTLKICETSRAVYVVTEAANFLLACCWKNNINKSRIAHKNGCAVLLQRIMKHSQSQDPQDVLCAERLCLALASVLMYQANHERMIVIKGLEEILKLCKIISEPTLLQSFGKIIVTMIPTPEEIILLHRDSAKHYLEKHNALPILKKVKLRGYADFSSAPEWLELAIELLAMSDYDLAKAAPVPKQEFVEQLYYSKEFVAEIKADGTINDTKEFRGLIFSIY